MEKNGDAVGCEFTNDEASYGFRSNLFSFEKAKRDGSFSRTYRYSQESWSLFGREQPALLIYQNCSEASPTPKAYGKEEPVDIFPHVTKGRRVSIDQFLEYTTTKLE